MRHVVIDTGCLHLLKDDKKVLDMIKASGFEHFDMTLFWKGETEHIGVGDDYLDNAKELRKYADSLGLKCEQSHAYFTSGIDQESLNRRIEYIQKDMRIAEILGAKVIVIHPLAKVSFEENVKFFNHFIPLAHELNIRIAIENIWDAIDGKPVPMISSQPDAFLKFLDALNDDCVGVCLDIGHAEMEGLHTSAVEMINALGSRIIALHIHDNNKVNDLHQMPYTNQINFKAILDALKKIKYKGNITFEVETCYSHGENPDMNVPFELYPAFLRLELEIGKYFANYLDVE